RFGALQGLNNGMLRTFARLPLSLGQALPRLMARRMGPTPNLGSTLQSIRRSQPTEIDYLSGAVVTAARQHGRAAPVNAALVDLVHEVERTGQFASADQVSAAVSV
ncbi:MAG: ketopantoate reductase C-terminal domain-containing protein, partial [Microbacteriaceae bacterium]